MKIFGFGRPSASTGLATRPTERRNEWTHRPDSGLEIPWARKDEFEDHLFSSVFLRGVMLHGTRISADGGTRPMAEPLASISYPLAYCHSRRSWRGLSKPHQFIPLQVNSVAGSAVLFVSSWQQKGVLQLPPVPAEATIAKENCNKWIAAIDRCCYPSTFYRSHAPSEDFRRYLDRIIIDFVFFNKKFGGLSASLSQFFCPHSTLLKLPHRSSRLKGDRSCGIRSWQRKQGRLHQWPLLNQSHKCTFYRFHLIPVFIVSWVLPF